MRLVSVGKGTLACSLLTPTWPHKNGPCTCNTSLPRRRESSHPVLDCSSSLGISIPVSHSMCVRLFCLSMCLRGHLLNPIALFVLFKERTRSFHFSTRVVCAGQMLCVSCWEGPTDHGGQTSTTEADLILSLLYVSKALLHPVLDWVCPLHHLDYGIFVTAAQTA